MHRGMIRKCIGPYLKEIVPERACIFLLNIERERLSLQDDHVNLNIWKNSIRTWPNIVFLLHQLTQLNATTF